MKLSYTIKSFVFASILIVSFTAKSQNFKVTLDAGHGGRDMGANYHGHVEKDINLAVALKLGKILEKQSSIDVNYTRTTDVLIDLVERGYIANRMKANIFVSLHCNANKNQSASGTQTFVMGLKKNTLSLDVSRRENEVITLEKDYKKKYKGFDPGSPESYIGQTLMQEEFLDNSIALASKIQDRFVKNLNKKDRGVAQDVFMVLHRATMPRVLVEMGFISNNEEGSVMDSEEGQQDIAQAIADAILSYKKEYFGDGDAVEDVTPTPPKQVKETPKTPDNSSNPIKGEATLYKVQLSRTAKKIALQATNFKGLKNISMLVNNKQYTYMYGGTTDYEEIKTQLKEAKSKGFDSAFIVTFKNGIKI